MVLVKELKIFHLYLLGKIDQKNILFCDILVRKHAFLDYRNKDFKMGKKLAFLKMG